MNDIRQLDFNLLKALDALLVERSVTRAALRLGLTQPAVSGMLARLRTALDDPLFVRASHGIAPTPRALALAEPLRRIIGEVETMLAPDSFEPAHSTARFTIAATDYAQLALLVPWMERLRVEAPSIRMALRGIDDARLMADFEQGRLDLALLTRDSAPPDLHALHLYDEHYVLAMREGHPQAGRPLSIEEFCALDQALVSLRGEPFEGVVDRALAALGHERRVVFSASCFLVLAQVLARSDLVAAVPARLLEGVSGLVSQPLPFAVPGFAKLAVWHERAHCDPAHRWLRSSLAAKCRAC